MPKAYSQMPRAMGVTEGQTGGGKVSGGTLGELKSGLGSRSPDWGAKFRTGELRSGLAGIFGALYMYV